MKTTFIRTEFNYDRDLVSRETGLECKDPSLADQSQRDEVDINTVIARFGITGHLPENAQLPMYAEFDRVYDRHSVMNEVIDAQTMYNQMPEAVRHLCGKNFRDFLQFVENPENTGKLVELGLAIPRESVVEEPLDNKAGNS